MRCNGTSTKGGCRIQRWPRPQKERAVRHSESQREARRNVAPGAEARPTEGLSRIRGADTAKCNRQGSLAAGACANRPVEGAGADYSTENSLKAGDEGGKDLNEET